MAVNEGAQRGRPEDQANLPDWLQDADIEVEADEEDISWASDIDFSNLPGWLAPDATDEVDELGMSDWETPTAPIEEDVEPEGTGLLAGVRGPIPIEPIITISHKAPPFPGSRPVSARQNVQQAAANPLPAHTQIQPAEPQQGSFRVLRLLLITLILIALAVTVVVAAGSVDILEMIPLIGMQLYG